MPAIHKELRKALHVEQMALHAIDALEKDVVTAKSTPRRIAVSRALNEAIDSWRKVHDLATEIRLRVAPKPRLRAERGTLAAFGAELAPDDVGGGPGDREPMDGDQAMGHDAEPSTGTNG